MRRAFLLIVAMIVLVVTGVSRGAAQDATPAAGVAPEPSECQVAPRSADELLALWYPNGTPLAATPEETTDAGTPVARGFEVPVGDPADAETIAAVTATVQEVFACFNGGDFLGAYALFSDDLIRSFAPDLGGMTADQAEQFIASEPIPAPEDQRIALIAVTDAVVIEDGRVGAIVVSVDPTVEPEEETVLIFFVEQDGRWLIDEIIEEDSTLAATPEA